MSLLKRMAKNPSQRATLKSLGIYSAFIVVVSSVVTSLTHGADKFQRYTGLSRQTANVVFPIIPLVFCALWLFPVCYKAYKRSRTIRGRKIKNEYFIIRPYSDSREDQQRYDRADTAHKKVLKWLNASDLPLLYLTGLSGAGKSSLINAFLMPQLSLDRSRNKCVKMPRYGKVRKKFRQELKAFLPARDTEFKGSTLALLGQVGSVVNGRFFVIIDQFEECLVLRQRTPARQRYINTLIETFQRSAPANVSIILSMRSDYRPFLEDINRHPPLPAPHAEHNWFELAPFKLSDAKTFLRASGLDLPPSVESKIFQQVARYEESEDFVRPVTLNMVGLILTWRLAHHEQLLGLGEADRFLKTYVIKAIRASNGTGSSRAVLDSLLETDGTQGRCVKNVEQLSRDTGFSAGLLLATLKQLQLNGITRSLDQHEKYWEISHDFVARLVNDVLRAWRISVVEVARICLLACSVLVASVYLFIQTGILRRHSPVRIYVESFGNHHIDGRSHGGSLNSCLIQDSTNKWTSLSVYNPRHDIAQGFYFPTNGDSCVEPSTKSDVAFAQLPTSVHSQGFLLSVSAVLLPEQPEDKHLREKSTDAPSLIIGWFPKEFKRTGDNNKIKGDYFWLPENTSVLFSLNADGIWAVYAGKGTAGEDTQVGSGRLFPEHWDRKLGTTITLFWNKRKQTVSAIAATAKATTNLLSDWPIPESASPPNHENYVGFGSDNVSEGQKPRLAIFSAYVE